MVLFSKQKQTMRKIPMTDMDTNPNSDEKNETFRK